MMEMSSSLALGAIFLWIAFVCAMRVTEALLKFRGAGMPVSVGFGGGKIASATMNKVEVIFAAVVVGSLMLMRPSAFATQNTTLFISVCLLLLQSMWLMPALNKRSEIIVNGTALPKSKVRRIYLATDLIKVSSLLVFGIHLFNS